MEKAKNIGIFQFNELLIWRFGERVGIDFQGLAFIGIFLYKYMSSAYYNASPENYSFSITKTCLYNSDPLEPHFYIVKLGFTGVYIIFLISG